MHCKLNLSVVYCAWFPLILYMKCFLLNISDYFKTVHIYCTSFYTSKPIQLKQSKCEVILNQCNLHCQWSPVKKWCALLTQLSAPTSSLCLCMTLLYLLEPLHVAQLQYFYRKTVSCTHYTLHCRNISIFFVLSNKLLKFREVLSIPDFHYKHFL